MCVSTTRFGASAAARHEEPDAVVHVMVERESVSAADEPYAVAAEQLEELVLARLEAPQGVHFSVRRSSRTRPLPKRR